MTFLILFLLLFGIPYSSFRGFHREKGLDGVRVNSTPLKIEWISEWIILCLDANDLQQEFFTDHN